MAINKVVYRGKTLIDLTKDTITPDALLIGFTAHNAAGERIYGAASGEIDMGSVMDAIYPVGSIYMSVNPENPFEQFGGEWVEWGKGKVIAGVDEEDPDFNESEKEGGSKDAIVVSHTHTQNSHTHTFTGASHSHGVGTISAASAGAHAHNIYVMGATSSSSGYYAAVTSGTSSSGYVVSGGAHTHSGSGTSAAASPGGTNTATTATNNAAGESGTGKNLQPYITCYMWKRVA